MSLIPPVFDNRSRDFERSVERLRFETRPEYAKRVVEDTKDDIERSVKNTVQDELCNKVTTALGVLLGKRSFDELFDVGISVDGLLDNVTNIIERNAETYINGVLDDVNDIIGQVNDITSGKAFQDEMADFQQKLTGNLQEKLNQMTNKLLRKVGLEGCRNQISLINEFTGDVVNGVGDRVAQSLPGVQAQNELEVFNKAKQLSTIPPIDVDLSFNPVDLNKNIRTQVSSKLSLDSVASKSSLGDAIGSLSSKLNIPNPFS